MTETSSVGESAGVDACVVLTTVPSQEQARLLARSLVEKRLAACVQMHAIESVYAWQGAIEHGDEILLLIKTRRSLYKTLETFIKQQHSYEVPEIIMLPVEAGLESYLNWLGEGTDHDLSK